MPFPALYRPGVAPGTRRRDQRGIGQQAGGRLRQARQQKILICRDFSGSDGTRTRDLRRDRPSRGHRPLATNGVERRYLQVLFTARLPRLRMVEPILESTFGPRVGHGLLSRTTTV